MQSVLIMYCFIAKCPYYELLYMQSVLMNCFICKVSLLLIALYAKCPYYELLYMQSVLIINCFICKVLLLLLVVLVNSGI